MASLKAILCAGAIALGTADLAQAADLLPPPPPVEPVYSQSFSGWYIRGDVGVGINNLSSARSTFNPFNPAGGPVPPVNRVETSIGDSGTLGFGVGYQVNNWFRFDATGEYRTSAAYRSVNTYNVGCPAGNSFCQDSYSANVASGVFLANGYVDVGTWYGVTPFFGAGVGGAINRFSGLTDLGLGSGYGADRNFNTLAWAVMAGLGFNITPNLKLEISYRYLDMGNLTSSPISCQQLAGCFFEKQSFHLASNDVRIGFRYMFADYARPAPPLIAKY